MKMLIAIVNRDDEELVAAGLSAGGYMSTRYHSHGGYLVRDNVTFLIGTADEEVERVKKIIHANVHRRETIIRPAALEYGGYAVDENESIVVSGATIFVVNAEQFERI